MPPATLSAICILETCKFLESGIWEQCPENPFSSMTSSIIQKLLSCMLPAHSELSRASIRSSRLLLTSGRLEYVDLLSAQAVEDYVSLFRKLSLGCQKLRRLLLPQLVEMSNRHVERALTDLLRNCTDLVEIHSNWYFDPDLLRNFARLRSLRLHFSDPEALKFTRLVTFDVMHSLGSIEVFAICKSIYFQTDTEEERHLPDVTKILDSCPRLTSVGYLDSSAALQQLQQQYRKRLRANHHFQLRSCYWISRCATESSEYCKTIKMAVESCPLLEVLVMEVQHAGCLKHLASLTNLTSLDLDFMGCANKYEKQFYNLLKEIGPQLQYLGIYGDLDKPLHLEMICDLCPNVSSLQIQCGITTVYGADLMRLKRLNASQSDREALLSLLSNRPHLKILCLDFCEELDDDVLREILDQNSFPELEVAHIHGSSLSERGLASFIRGAPKLREFSLGSPDFLNDDDVARCVGKLNPSCKCLPAHSYFLLLMNEFPRSTMEACCGF